MKNGRDFGELVILAGKKSIWSRDSNTLLIGHLSLFTVNKSTWSCLYDGFCPFPVYSFDHCVFPFYVNTMT